MKRVTVLESMPLAEIISYGETLTAIQHAKLNEKMELSVILRSTEPYETQTEHFKAILDKHSKIVNDLKEIETMLKTIEFEISIKIDELSTVVLDQLKTDSKPDKILEGCDHKTSIIEFSKHCTFTPINLLDLCGWKAEKAVDLIHKREFKINGEIIVNSKKLYGVKDATKENQLLLYIENELELIVQFLVH